MNIFNKLKTLQDVTANEQIIIDFILAQPTTFLTMTSDKICKACYVSAPTLYRLCTKLGVNGLSDLKLKLSGSLYHYHVEDDQFDYNYPIKKPQCHEDVMQILKEDYEQTLQTTMNLFEKKQLDRTVQAMRKAKQIDMYTSAGNLYFAMNFKFQMQEIGILVNVPQEEYLQRLTASASDEQHLAIVISFGGRGAVVKDIVKLLQQNHTPIVFISSVEENTLSQYATYQLYLCSYEHHYQKISSFSTRLSLLFLLDTLYTCYFQLDYEKHKQKKLAYYKKLSTKL